jgi:hypothetical protein
MVDETAIFALPSKPESRPESADSPVIIAEQLPIWKKGVLRSGLVWHERSTQKLRIRKNRSLYTIIRDLNQQVQNAGYCTL